MDAVPALQSKRGEVRICVRLVALGAWGARVSRGRLGAITGARGWMHLDPWWDALRPLVVCT